MLTGHKRNAGMYTGPAFYAGSFHFPAGVSLPNHATPPTYLGW